MYQKNDYNQTQYLRMWSQYDRNIQLMNEILNLQNRFAAMNARRSLHLEPGKIVDLYLWIAAIVEPFWRITTNQHQILKLALSPNLPCITTDQSALAQILVELLTNACKYTPRGKTITLSGALQNEVLSLCVANTGVEIPPNQLPFIFERYYRIPRNVPWQVDGVGLGLALVKQLVDHIGATILVDSFAERTLFTVLLPISS